MTEDEFAHAVRLLCQQFGGSVTSWGRTDARSQAVGGFPGDPHSHWFGADVVWDDSKHTDIDRVGLAFDKGLRLIHERDHDHLQPSNYPPGPLSDEQVEVWKGSSTG